MNILLLIFSLFGSLEWHTLESDHFKLSYPINYDSVAQKSIQYLENIHDLLTLYLKNTPRKTNVVISPTIESANGFARILPNELIHIYPFPPGADEGLGHYNNWLYQLLLHEYVHVVHLTTMSPFHRVINMILGNNVAPNHLLPKWIIEGFAVYYESHITGFGRFKSPYYEMLFRTSILNHDITLGEISNTTRHYPYGGIPYLYGVYFIGYLFKHHPLGKTGDFTNQYGNQYIPYRINGAFRAAKVGDIEQGYQDFKKEYRQKYQTLYQKLISEGITPYQPLFSGQNTPQILHLSEPQDGRVVIYSGGEHHTRSLHQYDHHKIKKIAGFSGIGPVEQYGGGLFFTRFTPRGNRMSRGLFYRNPKGKERLLIKDLSVVHITRGLSGLYLVVNDHGNETLWWYDPIEGDRKRLLTGTGLSTIGKPVMIGDDQLLFSMNRNEDFWDLYSYDLKTKKLKRLTDDLFTDLSPCYHTKQKMIYFISNRRDNIFNIYSYDLKTQEIRRRSNFFTGVTQLVCDTDQLYGSRHRKDDGFEGITIEYSDLIDEPAPKERFNHPFNVITGEKRVSYKKKSFSVFPEILPQRIKPEIQSANFQNHIMLDISGGDVRDQITYQSLIGYDFQVDDFFGSLYLSDTSYLLNYTLGYSYTAFVVPDYPVATDETAILNGQSHSFVATTGYSLSEGSSYGYLYLSAGYQYTTYNQPDVTPDPWKIKFNPISDREYGSLSFGFFYGDYNMLMATPGVSEGSGFNLRFSLSERSLYSESNSLTTALQYRYYIPLAFLNSAFSFNYNLSLGYREGGFSTRYIGGYPETTDWIQSMIDRTVISGAYLRGYPPYYFKGKMSQLLNIEYRQHLLYLTGGYATLPFYLHKIYCRLFYDVALIDPDKLYAFDPKQGIGGEILFQFFIGYLESYTLSLGYSYGINEGGGHQYYLNFTSLY